MAAAYFMAHFLMSFFPAITVGEAALLYCFIFLYLSRRRATAHGRSTGTDGKLRQRH
jgi:hypothetical protein